jgi:type IV pilus assembly protein PilM
LIESKIRVLTDAGLNPAIVDVEAFALHNAFEVNHPDAMNGLVALVNIGHDVTNINILDDGVPLLTRDLTVGTRRFREDLQRERGLSADEAQALVQGFDRSPHLESVLEGRGEEIAVGIERAAAFLAQNSRGGQLRAIYTCGGGSRIPGLNEMLATRLHLTVQQANPLANLKVRDGALDSLITDEIAPLLMLPIGLALRQIA